MKRVLYFLPIISMLIFIGCGKNVVEVPVVEEVNSVDEEKEQLKEELKEEIKQEIIEELKEKESEEPEITLENYDYRTDPDTLVVHIGDNNIDQYFDLKLIQSGDRYYVCTHSLMYDKGYVVVGYENCDLSIRYLGYENKEKKGEVHALPDNSDSYWTTEEPFDFTVASHFTSEETAKKFLMDIKECNPQFKYTDATIYYQKIEDIKFGYEIKDDKRIINGEETYFTPGNPY